MTTPPLPSLSSSGVEHRHLASLAAVARARSFRGAARDLGCSQSALSQHIAHLERLLAVHLLDRRRGSAQVELTDAGRVLLTHAEPILGTYRAAQADLEAVRPGARPKLRVGIADHLAAGLLTRVLPAFLQGHPGAEIVILEGPDGGTLAAAVAAGELDVAVGDPPREPAPLATRVLAPEPYLLLAPASWGVVRRAGTDPLALLAHLPLVRPKGDHDATRVERELRVRGVILSPSSTTTAPSSVVALVAAGTGAAIVPAGRARDGDPGVVALPLDGLVAPRNVVAAWQRERRAAPLVRAFVDTVAHRRPLRVAAQAHERGAAA